MYDSSLTITSEETSSFKQLDDDDVLLNILEFLDRSFVLETLALCSRHFYELAHKPYHYSRLLWKFSKTYYSKLDKIKSFYSALKYIEVVDSEKLAEVKVDQSRLVELTSFIQDHQETLRGVEIVFNKNQAPLFDSIVTVCGEWLTELSISVLVDSELAKYVCSRLHCFKKLRVLKLLVGKSVDPNVVFDSCAETIQSMHTFETSLYLYNKENLEKFCKCAKSLRNVSIAVNCDMFNDELLQLFTSCLMQKEKISLHFFNVPSVSFLNNFREVSTYCREMNISIVEIKSERQDEVLQLNKVQSFKMEFANFEPTCNTFPRDVKTIYFKPSSKIKPTLNLNDPTRFSFLTRLEISHTSMESIHNLDCLEVIILRECLVDSVVSVIEISSKLQSVQLIDCNFKGPSVRCPKRDHLRELSVVQSQEGAQQYDFYLSTLQELKLSILHLSSFVFLPDELKYIEDMTSLEDINIYTTSAEMIQTFKIEKLLFLKNLIISSPVNARVSCSIPNFLVQRILMQALIVLPASNIDSYSTYPLRPNLNEIDTKIISVVPHELVKQNLVRLLYYICSEKFIYLVLSVSGKYSTLVLEQEPPYNVVQWKMFKVGLSFQSQYFARHTRAIYWPEKKCSLM